MATAYHLEALRKHRVLERALEAKLRMTEKEAEKQKQHHHHHHHHHKRARPKSAQAQGVADLEAKKNKFSQTSRSVTPKTAKTEEEAELQVPTPSLPCSSHESRATTAKSTTSSHMETAGDPVEEQDLAVMDEEEEAASCQGGEALPRKPSSLSSHRNHSSSAKSQSSSRVQSIGTARSRASNRSSTAAGSASRLSCSTCVSCGTSSCSQCGLEGPRTRSGTPSTKSAIMAAAEKKANQVRKDLFKQELVLRDSNLVMGPVSVEQELLIRKLQERK